MWAAQTSICLAQQNESEGVTLSHFASTSMVFAEIDIK